MSEANNPNMNMAEVKTFFDHKIDFIVHEWLDKAHLFPQDEPFRDEIVKNGRKTVRLLQDYLQHPNREHTEKLTKKIVGERIKAKAELNVFLENIQIGREIVIRAVSDSSFSKDVQLELVLAVNRFFDQYFQHAVASYTALKESIINDKNRFIQEMHNDRLTILGQIAASFAHEFRNPLTSIKGFISLLEKSMSGDDKSDYYFSIINREMTSLEEKVSHFLYLSKMKGLDDQLETVDFSFLLEETAKFLYPRFLVESIDVRTTIEPELSICGVEAQIRQVFLNIMNNAVEGLSEGGGVRTIDIAAKRKDGKVYAVISNNGPKIPGHILDSIFEPFISTKELGTGLGLSVCKQIVEKHNGRIEVASDPGKTTFSLEFNESSQ